jgi:hypothetical protein
MPLQSNSQMMQTLCERATSPGSSQSVALQLLTEIVSEMNPVTASSLSLPWSFHEKCRAQFADKLLQRVFLTASSVAIAQVVSPPSKVATGMQPCCGRGVLEPSLQPIASYVLQFGIVLDIVLNLHTLARHLEHHESGDHWDVHKEHARSIV